MNPECSEIHERKEEYSGNRFLIVNLPDECLKNDTMIQEIWQHHRGFREEKELSKVGVKNHCHQCFGHGWRNLSAEDWRTVIGGGVPRSTAFENAVGDQRAAWHIVTGVEQKEKLEGEEQLASYVREYTTEVEGVEFQKIYEGSFAFVDIGSVQMLDTLERNTIEYANEKCSLAVTEYDDNRDLHGSRVDYVDCSVAFGFWAETVNEEKVCENTDDCGLNAC